MTTLQTLPSDHAARQAIRERLDDNMVVEAGAGTGKTTSLIGRVLALVTTGCADMGQIAAITFTDAAAAELRERIRESLEDAADCPDLQQEERTRCEAAVRDLDRASVQTLHSFAGSILNERPLEAGLPPGFQPRDEIQADIAFDEQWGEWLDFTLDDPQAQEALRPALEMGLHLGQMRQIASAFHKNYDLIEGASFDAPPMPCPTSPLLAVRDELERLSAFSKSDDDVLLAHVRVVLALASQVERADVSEAYRALAQSPKIRFGRGRQADWDTDPDTGQNACAAIKALLKEIDNEMMDDLERARAAVLAPILDLLKEFVLEYAAKRKADGVADFHDLLVWARDLLRDNIEVRDYFRERYSHIFIDEVQDTDPIQAEIAMFLAEDAPDSVDPANRPHDWRKVRPAPGKLFVVGDPKQSIYRFRRADIEQVKQLHERVGGRRENLTQNFRSLRPIIAWVNHVFGKWITEGDGQPGYIPLQAERSDGDPHPPVQYIGEEREGIVGQVRDEEARAIANVIRTALRDGWEVRSEDDGEPTLRAVTERDICILMRTRSGLSMLEFALDDAGIPYRIEGAAPVYETQEARDLLNCLSAIDDPTDDVSVVAALRSPAFACSDVDLLKFVEGHGQFDYLAEGEFPRGRVSDSLRVLKEFHERRAWIAPSRLIEEFVRERNLMELAMSQRRPRERWRRYRFLIDQARAFASSGEPSLRAFVAWAERQRTEGARMVESPIPESDEDAVRVMTMHAAKGLEFPVVILTGLNSAPSRHRNAVLFDRSNQSVEVGVGPKGSAFRTPGYEALSDLEEKREAEEDARLLYVAATRARDHLVVSMYRPAKADNSLAAQIAGYIEDTCGLWRQFTPDNLPHRTIPDSSHSLSVDDAADDDTPSSRARWQEQRKDAYARSARRQSVAVTTLAKESSKQEQEIPEEPWRRGRAGTSIGKAVHAVLQMVDLETRDGLDDIAKAQADAEGVPTRATEIARLATLALESDLVGRAIRSGHWWREVPVAAPLGPGIVEGFIDLLFQEEDGFVIVDYKTDALRSDDDIRKAMRRYELQGGGYALALNAATGVHVKEVSFLFLNPNRVEPIGDLGEAVRQAKCEALLSLSDDPPHDDAGRPRSLTR